MGLPLTASRSSPNTGEQTAAQNKKIVDNNAKYQTKFRKQLRTYGTISEATLWLQLKNRQIENIKFRRQFGVGGYILDFYAPELKLSIELDGSVHDSVISSEYDYKRKMYLQNFGIEEMRFDNADVRDRLQDVVDAIADKIKELKSNK